MWYNDLDVVRIIDKRLDKCLKKSRASHNHKACKASSNQTLFIVSVAIFSTQMKGRMLLLHHWHNAVLVQGRLTDAFSNIPAAFSPSTRWTIILLATGTHFKDYCAAKLTPVCKEHNQPVVFGVHVTSHYSCYTQSEIFSG